MPGRAGRWFAHCARERWDGGSREPPRPGLTMGSSSPSHSASLSDRRTFAADTSPAPATPTNLQSPQGNPAPLARSLRQPRQDRRGGTAPAWPERGADRQIHSAAHETNVMDRNSPPNAPSGLAPRSTVPLSHDSPPVPLTQRVRLHSENEAFSDKTEWLLRKLWPTIHG